MEWQPIERSTEAVDRCILWCCDTNTRKEPIGVVFGRIFRYDDGGVSVTGAGMNGDWTFTHWMPLPAPPSSDPGIPVYSTSPGGFLEVEKK